MDGKTVVKFLKSWAHISKYGTMPQDFDSPMLLDHKNPYAPSAKEIDDVVRFTFELTLKNVKKLKERAKSESTRSDLHLSTFVVTYTYVLTCVVKTRGGDANQPVPFVYNADFRERLDPPVPMTYFGNCVMPINFSGYKVETFLGEDGFVNGVKILSDWISDLSSRGAESIWELHEEGLKVMELGTPKLAVIGSNKCGIYGSDFGWGRPVHTENISVSENLLISMSETWDVEIGICLKKCEMDVFNLYFKMDCKPEKNDFFRI
ncbi:unnamed protein product [Thlaspi arvense]|uniref:Uncharacterized protein n=1 Tax=Thlaspi arvense TaxID=13288 RepID=A0AAU9SER6_THLAR|nr:unnamed protein product [Thlaspi arvense]